MQSINTILSKYPTDVVQFFNNVGLHIIPAMANLLKGHENNAKNIYYFYGTGNNGKTVIINILKKIMMNESYISNLIDYKIYDCDESLNKKLVIINDPQNINKLNNALMEISGNDAILCTSLNGQSVMIQPKCKLLIDNNMYPTGLSQSLSNRIEFVNFNNVFNGPHKDYNLVNRIYDNHISDIHNLLNEVNNYNNNNMDTTNNIEDLTKAFNINI